MEFVLAIYLLLNAGFGQTVQQQSQYRETYLQTGRLPTVTSKVRPWQQTDGIQRMPRSKRAQD